MAAFNFIHINITCPFCQKICLIECQTHIASSYDGINGRFHNNIYTLGQKMLWWEKDNSKYNSWNNDSDEKLNNKEAIESCYSECTICKTELIVRIYFKELIIEKVLSIAIEK
jgi:hypothetical protein